MPPHSSLLTEMSDSESAKKNRFEGSSSLSEPEQINKSMKQDPPLWPLVSPLRAQAS